MALIDSKQLSKNLSGSFAVNTGSFFVSGSDDPTQGSYVLSTSGSINTTGTGRVYEVHKSGPVKGSLGKKTYKGHMKRYHQAHKRMGLIKD